ncbi:hypothetical protein NQ315_007957 [Exocentrus adspersus]|uniref:Uncharacterized protein n=1 Tax=Exocentrus adspersus TaxID=1586481 RepID=A0AAV8V7C8_9CUCU|nr:hypothetical protein NQ315_007957 [Exocentrus adspersus]
MTARRKAVKAQDTTDPQIVKMSNRGNVKVYKMRNISAPIQKIIQSDENIYPPLPKKNAFSQPVDSTPQHRHSLQRQTSSKQFCSANSSCIEVVPNAPQKQLKQFNRLRFNLTILTHLDQTLMRIIVRLVVQDCIPVRTLEVLK